MGWRLGCKAVSGPIALEHLCALKDCILANGTLHLMQLMVKSPAFGKGIFSSLLA
jgi:hypothetical protein